MSQFKKLVHDYHWHTVLLDVIQAVRKVCSCVPFVALTPTRHLLQGSLGYLCMLTCLREGRTSTSEKERQEPTSLVGYDGKL